MKSKYLRQLYTGTIGEMKTLETYFTKMAAKGWLIEKLGLFAHRYRASEPGDKQFFVDFFPQTAAASLTDNQQAQEYRHLCAKMGWTYLTSNRHFHVFCADATESPSPVHKDNRIQAQLYMRACWRYELLPYAISTFMLLFLLWSQLTRTGIDLLFSNLQLFLLLGFIGFIIGYSWVIGFVMTWYRNLRRAAKRDLPLPIVNYRLSRIRSKLFIAGMYTFVVCLISGIVLEIFKGISPDLLGWLTIVCLGLGLALWLRWYVNHKHRTPRAHNRLIIAAIVVIGAVLTCAVGFVGWNMINPPHTDDPLDGYPVVTLADIGITTPPSTTTSRLENSIAVPVWYSYNEMNPEGSTHLTVYHTVNTHLARRLYQHYSDELVLKYQDRDAYAHAPMPIDTAAAAVWDADEGMVIANQSGQETELVLLRDRSVVRLFLSAEDLRIDTTGSVIRGIWTD